MGCLVCLMLEKYNIVIITVAYKDEIIRAHNLLERYF